MGSCKNKFKKIRFILTLLTLSISTFFSAETICASEPVKIGLNRPETGPYIRIGLDQERAATLAAEEINASGGLLSRPIEIIMRDSRSRPGISKTNVIDLIENQNVSMIFGGASSGVAIKVGEICQEKGTVFMATVTAANETTGIKGHRHTFRACYNAWMGAKALGKYLQQNFSGKRFFYVVADYSWGRSAETSIRKFSNTEDRNKHKSAYTVFPGATDSQFRNKIKLAETRQADVLVLAHFGNDMTRAVRLATELGLKKKMQIVVPILELSMCETAGPEAMEGIIGTSDWNWRVPHNFNYARGIKFVEKFRSRYGRYPCWGAATAYTALWEYCNAVRRAQSLKPKNVIKSLEGHSFTLLKDKQKWRSFDHQNVQTVYLVRCKNSNEVKGSYGQQDYFDNIDHFSGAEVVRTEKEWQQIRLRADMPNRLEKLLGE
ncbi:MAG: ABC transporter substrate-binding protein [Desulfobacteraceae bacterium]|nr:ABC transporter substrate-binding protein [Desulfobacteraceae bacterium]